MLGDWPLLLSGQRVELGAAFLSGTPQTNRLWSWLITNGRTILDHMGGYQSAWVSTETWVTDILHDKSKRADKAAPYLERSHNQSNLCSRVVLSRAFT